jgi:HEAT repeats
MWKAFKPRIEKKNEKKDLQSLIEALGDKDSSIATAAANALGDQGDPGAVKPLKEKAVTGNLAAISALGRIGGSQAIDVLVYLTQREDFPHHVMAGIIQALGKAGDPQIVEHIKGFLTNEDDWVLGETLAVLRKFLSEKEVAFLIQEQQELKNPDLEKKGGVLLCESCRKNFTQQQARIESIENKDGTCTRYLFLCPECGSKLLDSKGQPYEEVEENPTEDETEDQE